MKMNSMHKLLLDRKQRRSLLISLTLLLYILTVLWYTILKREVAFHATRYELFWSYKEWLRGDAALGIQILENIAMLIPFGLLISALLCKWDNDTANSFPKKPAIFLISVLAAFFSLFIECLQLFLMRGMFEFDDILNNTLGAFIGCMLYYVLWLMPEKYGTRLITIVCGAVLVICAGVVVSDGINESVKADQTPEAICFQIDHAEMEGKQLTLTGCAFDYERRIKYFSVILRSTRTGKEIPLSTTIGFSRPEINRYFQCDNDYSDVGFSASGTVNPSEEYEVRLQSQWLTSFSTGVYITGADIHYIPSNLFAAPKVSGTSIEPIVNHGFLRAYRPDFHCWVYQYDGALYWIADQDFFFEEDCTTYIQYHLHTTQIQNLPQHRLENNWFWDNIGGHFEQYELVGDFGQYRVMKRELPTEYSITSITTGYYKDGKWIWQECFRPVYDW